jgi:hypothetical protein
VVCSPWVKDKCTFTNLIDNIFLQASCRRNFALDVALLDALGRSIHKEMEVCCFFCWLLSCLWSTWVLYISSMYKTRDSGVSHCSERLNNTQVTQDKNLQSHVEWWNYQASTCSCIKLVILYVVQDNSGLIYGVTDLTVGSYVGVCG